MTNKKSISQFVKKINNIRKLRKSSLLIVNLPKVDVKKIAIMCANQEEFLCRERIIMNLLLFYACNTLDFTSIISDPLRKAVDFDENYIDECVCDIATLIGEDKVYLEGNELFYAWTTEKKKNSKLLSYEEAIEQSNAFIEGGI